MEVDFRGGRIGIHGIRRLLFRIIYALSCAASESSEEYIIGVSEGINVGNGLGAECNGWTKEISAYPNGAGWCDGNTASVFVVFASDLFRPFVGSGRVEADDSEV